MRFLFARIFAIALALAAFVVVPMDAFAAPFELSPSRPSVRVDTPGAWASKRIPRGLQTNSADEELYVWLEVYSPGELTAVIAEHDAYWTKQGVVIRGRKQESGEKDGRSFLITQIDAVWNGEPTVLYYMELDLKLPSGRKLVLTYWASPKGDRVHAAGFETLMDSLVISER